MQTVYLETSVIGYLASIRSSDLVVAANQLLTFERWTDHRSKFELFASQATVDECAAGDLVAARELLGFSMDCQYFRSIPRRWFLPRVRRSCLVFDDPIVAETRLQRDC